MDLSINKTSFRAKLGSRVLKKVSREFDNDLERINKYALLFKDTFSNNIDKNTVIDINKHNYFVLSHDGFPKIKYQHYSKLKKSDNLAKALINECSKVYGNAELNLFRVIVSDLLKKGMSIQEIKEIAQKALITPKSRDRFMENIKIAERILNENSASKLSKEEFDYMNMKIMQEEAETEGTELHNLIYNFGDLKKELK